MTSFQNIDLGKTLQFGWPGKFGCGDTYDSIIWLSEDPKPTEDEILAKWDEYQASKVVKAQFDAIPANLTQSFKALIQKHIGQKYLTGDMVEDIVKLQGGILLNFSDPETAVLSKIAMENFIGKLPVEMESDAKALLALIP